ncbi:MAG: DNA mismatch repair protein MutS [Muribaculaceae bacterium]
MAKKIVETPLMKQYVEMKAKHPDAILLFRVGDFYETFSDDAIAASEILGITLTRRANGAAQYVELAGFPHHALDSYLPKLIRAGKRVAICEQLEDPKLTKKLVKRGITELVTPGVAMSDNVLNHRENNFLAALHFGKNTTGVAFLDISTGEFLVGEGTVDYCDKLLASFAPKELLIESGNRAKTEQLLSARYLTFDLDDWIFTTDAAMERLLKQFKTAGLKGFGVDKMSSAIIAAGAILHYLDITQHTNISHITSLSRIEADRYVRLDKFTVRNLELVAPMAEGGMSLLEVIDRTVSPMGARLLQRWLLFPLKDVKAITDRHEVVEYLMRNPEARETLLHQLSHIGDLERLTGKVAGMRITPREMVQVATALTALVPIKEMCAAAPLTALNATGSKLNLCEELCERIKREILPDAPNAIGKGDVIARGVSAELDELRTLAGEGKQYLLHLQQREIEATGITSLKVGYNNVFGYYMEVTNTHKDKVPPEWIRKQTLVNAERYITQELKEYEEKILGANDRILALESELYGKLLSYMQSYIPVLQTDAAMLARLDCLLSFTRVSLDNKYNRPVIDDSLDLELVEARHPVIERRLPAGEPYISNTVRLNNEKTQIMMITGPNMSGKSALLRQTALNVILAQIGCFVAADSAKIGIVDKIFTRVGASDNISLGESTFMVEMTEAAAILNNISSRSLILFDELGRGTSTYDGISIARAIVEHLHEFCGVHPKTLFATHYHELNELEKSCPRVVNYNVSVREIDGKVVFLRKLAKGGSAHSFGIHVARLAGMPPSIVSRAEEVLHELEQSGHRGDIPMPTSDASDGMQMRMFELDDPVLSQIRDRIIGLDINNLTPLAALSTLAEIRDIITGK